MDISNLNEPEFVVAFDGNFQHGRHQAASHELEEINVSYPSTFMEPKEIDKWKPQEEGNVTNDEPVCIHWSARFDCEDSSCLMPFRISAQPNILQQQIVEGLIHGVVGMKLGYLQWLAGMITVSISLMSRNLEKGESFLK